MADYKERDDMSDGMGLERPDALEGTEKVKGSEASDRDELLRREVARFEELRSKAMGTDKPITNQGIVLDSFDK